MRAAGLATRAGHTDTLGASPGEFYEAITAAMGFIPLRHEGKVLGLAAHGDARKLYGDFHRALRASPGRDHPGNSFDSEFVGRDDAYSAREAYLKALVRAHPREDVAAAAQAVFEDAIVEVARDLLARSGQRRLAVNGGVFANVKLNQRLAALPELDRLFVFPAMSDTGNSVGAALLSLLGLDEQGQAETLRTAYWGSEWDEAACAKALTAAGFALERLEEDALVSRAADAIHAGQVVGWFQGRMEFGPRALGARSILGDARAPGMQTTMNVQRRTHIPLSPMRATVARNAARHKQHEQ